MDTSPDLGKKRGKPDEPEPTSEGKRDRISYEDVDLTKYIETRYVSKNKNLKKILAPLESGNWQNSLIGIIEPLIRSNDWRGFDSFCETHKGADNFWDILQCLFYLRYFAEEKIDFDQMQKAMGIQQTRWSVDPTNECYRFFINMEEPPKGFYTYFDFTIGGFTYFNKLPEKRQNQIVKDFFDLNFSESNLITEVELLQKKRETETKTMNQIKSDLGDRIFYKVSTTNTKFPWTFGYEKYSDKVDTYLGIPQTYDLTSVTCYHKPILIFGSLGPKTMVNFILKNDMRPFAAHLPGSTSNLTKFDGFYGSLIHNWRHDFFHQSLNKYCNIGETITKAEKLCTEEGDLPGEDSIPEDWLKNVRFQKCLDTDRDRNQKDPLYNEQFLNDEVDSTAEAFLDTADIFRKYTPHLIGGKKTKRRNRKTRGKKQKRSRKHP
jgi:hypothetical protein